MEYPVKLYPVWGSTGEYGDYSAWIVGLFRTRRSAEAVAKYLNGIAEAQGVFTTNFSATSRELREAAKPILKAAGDPIAYIDYTGIEYHVGAKPLHHYVDFADFKMTAPRRAAA